MDEDLITVKAVKSHRNALKLGKMTKCTAQSINEDYELLTTKNAVKFLLEGSLKYKVCRFCLNIASPLSELDEIFEVARKGAIYKVTLRVMIASVHPFKVPEDPNFPDKVCTRCVESAISSYMFSQQCERAERALHNCFDDINTKFEKLDPLHRPKKRGRQKLNPNPNVLYAEHNDVIDYAEPIIHIINVNSTSLEDEKQISPFECPKCWQVLPDVESLVNHQSIHPKSMWYSCRLCGQCFANDRVYKKHIRNAHKDGEIVRAQQVNTNFRCNECGVKSTSFGEHLQHTEKHKFKTTFKHLLDRSMHRLCAVCLEKKACLTHMNETIQFNGGYPGLNNEQAIYNIVSSTFPEPRSYKYQELFIPTRASIMTITKRMDPLLMKKQKPPYVDKKMFEFCNPTILIAPKMEFDTLYMFIFSDPYKLTDLFLDKKSISHKLSNPIKENINHTVDPTFSIRKFCSKSNKTDDTSFKNNKKDDQETTSHKHIETYNYKTLPDVDTPSENSVELCKICWIFNKPSCDECTKKNLNSIKSNQTNMNRNEIVTDKEKCKYCWLFKAVGKCDYCKKLFKESEEKNCNTKLTQIFDAQNIETKVDYGINMRSTFDPEFKDNTRKRKSTSELTLTQKCKWQCRICLTNNEKTRQTCFCCDFDTNVMDNNSIFKFGVNRNTFQYNTEKNTTNLTNLSNKISKTVNETYCEPNLPKNIPTSLEKYNLSTIFTDTVPMDVEMINSNDLQNNSNDNENDNFNPFVKDESMEVAYEDVAKPSNPLIILPSNLSFVNENIDALSNANIMNSTQLMPQNTPFQFNIGTSTTTNPKQKSPRDIRRRTLMGRK